MTVTELEIEGVWLIKNDIYTDQRGSFQESFNHQKFEDLTGVEINFVQDNHSVSKKNVFRGLHFQLPPHGQAKLVRVTKGSVIDVFLDLRTKSSTFKKLSSIKLTENDGQALFIPEGLAHGFLATEEDTHFQYKCSNYYHPASEETIRFKDSWTPPIPESEMILNEKDLTGKPFSLIESPF